MLLAILALFLVSLFIMVKRQKNQLGQMVGFGCAAILALESARYLLYNLGLGLMPAAGIPFLTYGGSTPWRCTRSLESCSAFTAIRT